jgi:AraC-like DNA-binding protein
MPFFAILGDNCHTMQPKLEKILTRPESSISVKREITPYMDYPWHYHPEYEIIYVARSHGIRMMGDHIGNFRDGDMVFISPNLPHVWRNDHVYYQNSKHHYVDVYVIHFRENALKEGFFDLPEFSHIKKLFRLGQQGMLIQGADHQKLAGLIKKVNHSEGLDRLFAFQKTLDLFARTSDYMLLSSEGFAKSFHDDDSARINKVFGYILDHYDQSVRLDEIANLINMNKTSFCRYFKYRTKKTFTQFLNEIRIAHACKLLLNNDSPVSEVCYATGYNNISHFNRQFRLIQGMSAKAYVNKHRVNE